MVAVANHLGKLVYTRLEDIPPASSS
jgi:hypothetical protein